MKRKDKAEKQRGVIESMTEAPCQATTARSNSATPTSASWPNHLKIKPCRWNSKWNKDRDRKEGSLHKKGVFFFQILYSSLICSISALSLTSSLSFTTRAPVDMAPDGFERTIDREFEKAPTDGSNQRDFSFFSCLVVLALFERLASCIRVTWVSEAANGLLLLL